MIEPNQPCQQQLEVFVKFPICSHPRHFINALQSYLAVAAEREILFTGAVDSCFGCENCDEPDATIYLFAETKAQGEELCQAFWELDGTLDTSCNCACEGCQPKVKDTESPKLRELGL
jgi:hypothetical protein